MGTIQLQRQKIVKLRNHYRPVRVERRRRAFLASYLRMRRQEILLLLERQFLILERQFLILVRQFLILARKAISRAAIITIDTVVPVLPPIPAVLRPAAQAQHSSAARYRL